MTEPTAPRPVPGPPRPGPGAGQGGAAPGGQPGRPSFDELDALPVTEHVTVYEAEHARLQRELGTIDQV